VRWPIGGTPPTAYPVAVRTNAGLGLARHLDPSSRACHVWVVVRGRDRVVPIPVKVMADQVAVLELRHVPVGNLDAPGVGVVSSMARTLSPDLVVTALMVSMITSWDSSGRPRQFIEM